MESINIFQRAIEQLVLEGHIILQIIEPSTKETLYFSVYKWQEGYFNTAQSIDFNTIEGVNITEFIIKNSSRSLDRVEFISQFNRVIGEGILVRCEFAKNTPWYKWSAPNGMKKN